jgi:SPX domain protein involved in polyphosphate accumulation
MRFERKYRIDNLSLQHVQQVLRVHPASFYKIFPDRVVNNIYFDTPHMSCLQDNLNGVNIRKKYRLRWYGPQPHLLKNPQLEIKFKENDLGGKTIFKLGDAQLNDLYSISNQVHAALTEQLVLQPTLLNSYQRSYWGTKDKKFRITIDSGLRFHPLLYAAKFSKYRIFDQVVIVELKYEKEDEKDVHRIIDYLPFRLSKNSKYVQGILLTQ